MSEAGRVMNDWFLCDRVGGVLLAGLVACTACPVEAAQCLPYEPAVVTLAGTIVVQQAFGAPNYGKTPDRDAIERFYALQLDAPICMSSGNDTDTPEDHVARLQLVMGMLPSAPTDVAVRVTGTLFHAVSGHDHTAVLLSVRSVALKASFSPTP